MSAPSTSPEIQTTIIPDSAIPSLLSRLAPHLPYSLPLYRRLQFHQSHPSTPEAHAFLATSTFTSSNSSESNSDSSPWLAVHIDLANAGQTQVWLYASWERPQPPPSSSPTSASLSPLSHPNTPATPTQKSLLTSLLRHLHTLTASLPLEPPAEWYELDRTGKYLSKPYSRRKVLFGTVNECVWDCLPHDQEPSCISRVDRWYLKFLFPPPLPPTTAVDAIPQVESSEPQLVPLSHTNLQTVVDRRYSKSDGNEARFATDSHNNLTLGPLSPPHLLTVFSRTPIPRTLTTLALLPSLGLFTQPPPQSVEPIGWGLLGKDASLSSLHTEPEYRGQGHAARLSNALFAVQRAKGSVFYDEERERGWAHADVSESNAGSLRVMEKLGGVPMWRVCWVEINLAVLFGDGSAMAPVTEE